jgi:hypothetical protein
MAALGRLHAARELETGRTVPLSEIALELITTHPRFQRALELGDPAAAIDPPV